MAGGDSNRELSRIRRQDRAVEDQGWIREFLRRAPYGVLATAAGDQPFLHANTFVYDQAAGVIYFHTAREGRTPGNLQANPRVCFMVSEMGRLLPGKTAFEFSCEYASVVVFGQAELVGEDGQARHALQQLLDKYFPQSKPGRDYRALTAEELTATAVFRIRIEQWSGKLKRAPDDFPGAFAFPDGLMLGRPAPPACAADPSR